MNVIWYCIILVVRISSLKGGGGYRYYIHWIHNTNTGRVPGYPFHYPFGYSGQKIPGNPSTTHGWKPFQLAHLKPEWQMYAAQLLSVCHMWPYCESRSQQAQSHSHHPSHVSIWLKARPLKYQPQCHCGVLWCACSFRTTSASLVVVPHYHSELMNWMDLDQHDHASSIGTKQRTWKKGLAGRTSKSESESKSKSRAFKSKSKSKSLEPKSKSKSKSKSSKNGLKSEVESKSGLEYYKSGCY